MRITGEPIDLSQLPPLVLVAVDYEAELADLKAKLVARFKANGVDFDVQDLETDPVISLAEEFTDRKVLGLDQINDAGKRLTLASSYGVALDHIAATYYADVGVRRLPAPGVVQPRPFDLFPGDWESDDRFRRRIQLAPETRTPGTLRGYEYWALTAAPALIDARAFNYASPGSAARARSWSWCSAPTRTRPRRPIAIALQEPAQLALAQQPRSSTATPSSGPMSSRCAVRPPCAGDGFGRSGHRHRSGPLHRGRGREGGPRRLRDRLRGLRSAPSSPRAGQKAALKVSPIRYVHLLSAGRRRRPRPRRGGSGHDRRGHDGDHRWLTSRWRRARSCRGTPRRGSGPSPRRSPPGHPAAGPCPRRPVGPPHLPARPCCPASPGRSACRCGRTLGPSRSSARSWRPGPRSRASAARKTGFKACLDIVEARLRRLGRAAGDLRAARRPAPRPSATRSRRSFPRCGSIPSPARRCDMGCSSPACRGAAVAAPRKPSTAYQRAALPGRVLRRRHGQAHHDPGRRLGRKTSRPAQLRPSGRRRSALRRLVPGPAVVRLATASCCRPRRRPRGSIATTKARLSAGPAVALGAPRSTRCRTRSCRAACAAPRVLVVRPALGRRRAGCTRPVRRQPVRLRQRAPLPA